MTKRILLVDDDTDDAGLFCEANDQIGLMECYTAENGPELFNLLSLHQINDSDFIFLDINMPVMDGWECLKQLKNNATYRDIPVLMYSTSSARRDIDKAYSLGASLFITKPEDFRELSGILKTVAGSTKNSLQHLLRGFKSVKIA